MNIEQLKKQYDDQSVNEIETGADRAKNRQVEARKEFIGRLFYLMKTKRFHENKQYEKAEFKDYLYGRFMMLEGTFNNERKAYIMFPEETEKIGPALVTKVRQSCDSINAKKALGEIGKLKPNRNFRDKADAVIQKYAKPAPKPKRESISDVKSDAKILKAELDKANATIAEQNKTIKAQAKQIRKLKDSVAWYREQLDAPLSQFIPTRSRQADYAATV